MQSLHAPASRPLDELRHMAQDNPDLFKRKLKSLLRMKAGGEQYTKFSEDEKDDPEMDASAIAEMLRATTMTLADMGMDDRDINTSELKVVLAAHFPMLDLADGAENYWWAKLKACLPNAQPDDAIAIFTKMAESLEGKSWGKRVELMQIALAESWGAQAAEAAPSLFLAHRTKAEPKAFRLGAGENHGDNAFQVLASVSPRADSSHESIIETIRALKRIGVQDFPSLDSSLLCIHVAALHQAPAGLRAFIEEFPGDLNAVDDFKKTPLHWAACSKHPGNVKLLLQAGVEPRPMDQDDWTPMAAAADNSCFDNVMVLIETGAYTLDDVERASDCFADELQARMLAYQAAIQARQAVDGAEHNAVQSPKPL